MIASLYKKVVTNSVAYMMMTRLGIDTGEYFEADDFRDVTNFNTQDTMNALGFATSDIAEMGLTEISKTVMALNRQNRIIEANRQSEYNKDIKDERSSDYERDIEMIVFGIYAICALVYFSLIVKNNLRACDELMRTANFCVGW